MTQGDLSEKTLRKIGIRILPLLALAYLFAWLDKFNVGFAALQMNESLGFTNTEYGLGVGFYSIAYVLFAVPGAMLLRRFGARRWLGFVIIACSLCSLANAFIGRPIELWVVRAVLGLAEASVAPGMVVYLSFWFPEEYRARAWSTLLLISPFALVIGGPVSGLLLGMNGIAGFKGWQWLFITEAIPTFFIGISIFFLLTNRPSEAKWLSPSEKGWLRDQMGPDEVPAGQKERGGLRLALSNGRVRALALIFFGFGASGAGPLYFLPSMVKSMGYSASTAALLVAIPAIVGGLSLPLWGRWADRTRHGEYVLIAAGCLHGIGSLLAALLLPAPLALAGFSIAMICVYGVNVSFTLLPSIHLSKAATAAAIGLNFAAINIGIFAGSFLVGKLVDLTGSFRLSLIASGAIGLLVASLAVLLLLHGKRQSAETNATEIAAASA